MKLPAFTDLDIQILKSTLEGRTSKQEKKKLEVMLTLAKQGESKSSHELAKLCGVSRATLYRWIAKFKAGHVASLLHTNYRCSHRSELASKYKLTQRRDNIRRLKFQATIPPPLTQMAHEEAIALVMHPPQERVDLFKVLHEIHKPDMSLPDFRSWLISISDKHLILLPDIKLEELKDPVAYAEFIKEDEEEEEDEEEYDPSDYTTPASSPFTTKNSPTTSMQGVTIEKNWSQMPII